MKRAIVCMALFITKPHFEVEVTFMSLAEGNGSEVEIWPFFTITLLSTKPQKNPKPQSMNSE